MKAGHRINPLSLSELSDQTTIKEKSDPGLQHVWYLPNGRHLNTYRLFADQWSILTYDTHYDFRIQITHRKKW
jgi:hypothetical protein